MFEQRRHLASFHPTRLGCRTAACGEAGRAGVAAAAGRTWVQLCTSWDCLDNQGKAQVVARGCFASARGWLLCTVALCAGMCVYDSCMLSMVESQLGMGSGINLYKPQATWEWGGQHVAGQLGGMYLCFVWWMFLSRFSPLGLTDWVQVLGHSMTAPSGASDLELLTSLCADTRLWCD